MGFLYKLDFPSGKSYIGITSGQMKTRINNHARDARLHLTTSSVHNAWRKYGQPKIIVLAEIENYVLSETEQKAISVYGTQSPHGYNLTSGGEHFFVTDEVKEKLRIAMTGKRHSEETRKKISLVQIGRVASIETRNRMSSAHSGKKKPASTGAKLKAYLTGNPTHPMKRTEVAEKVHIKTRGRKQSEEERAMRSSLMRIAWANGAFDNRMSKRER